MKKLFILTILLFLIASSNVFAETWYFRGDQHTVNGVTGYKLTTSNSSSGSNFDAGELAPGCGGGSYDFDIIRVENDGTETTIGSARAETTRSSGGEGIQSATWSCPETYLETTDAIKIVARVTIIGLTIETRTFITSQLGATKLDTATWTFYRYSFYGCVPFPSNPGLYENIGKIYHGDSSHATRTTGISYTTYQDVGIRLYNGTSVVKIGAQELDGHKLRFYDGSTTYGIPLLDTSDGDASPVRIYDGSNVKALPEVD